METPEALPVQDSAPEALFGQVTRLAAEACDVPVALVGLIDAQQQWFHYSPRLPGLGEVHRDLAFCTHTLAGNALFEVPDATQDPRFAAHPLVTGTAAVRFYAGVPIVLAHGAPAVGTLCVADRVARRLTDWQRAALAGAGRVLAAALQEQAQHRERVREWAAAEARYRHIVEGQSELVSLSSPEGVLVWANPAYARFFGMPPQGAIGRNLLDFVAEHDRGTVREHLLRAGEHGDPAESVNRNLTADGQERWVAWTNRPIPARDGQPALVQSVGRDVTAQRRAEQALLDSEVRHRRLYEATPAMLHSIDPQGRLLSVSDTWLQALGYTRDEVIGHPYVDFLTPASRQQARDETLPAFFRTGRSDDVACQMVRADGAVIDVLMSALLERDEQGNPLRSLTVAQNVTERKAVDAALHETRHTLQQVLDNLPARISYWDTDCHNRFANAAFLKWFGITDASIAGRHVREVVGEAWHARIQPLIAAGLRGEAGRIETTSTGHDGTRLDIDLRFTPDRGGATVRGLLVFGLDITARREAERRLADRDRIFELLVNSVRDYAIYVLDPQGRVATWNIGAERNKGYRADEVLGRHFGMFFTPEDRAGGLPAHELEQAARDGRFESEGWRQRGDGSRFWAGVLLSAIRDERQQLVGYAKITRDLSEQRRQRAANEQALAEKETLLKEVYHRVKNNLQVVQSLLTLQSNALPEGAARTAVIDSAQRVRAMSLVHEKLYQARNLAAVALPAYTAELVKHIAEAHGADRRQIMVHVDIADVQTGLDSAVPFGLLLTELITNGLKHGFPGGPGGNVWVRLSAEAGGHLLTVIDNGVGFAEGFDLAAQTGSMGLQLAGGLASQLGGELRARTLGGAVLSALLTRL